MAVYTAESGQTPARVTLMRMPEKAELRQKNMYSVSGESTGYPQLSVVLVVCLLCLRARARLCMCPCMCLF